MFCFPIKPALHSYSNIFCALRLFVPLTDLIWISTPPWTAVVFGVPSGFCFCTWLLLGANLVRFRVYLLHSFVSIGVVWQSFQPPHHSEICQGHYKICFFLICIHRAFHDGLPNVLSANIIKKWASSYSTQASDSLVDSVAYKGSPRIQHTAYKQNSLVNRTPS